MREHSLHIANAAVMHEDPASIQNDPRAGQFAFLVHLRYPGPVMLDANIFLQFFAHPVSDHCWRLARLNHRLNWVNHWLWWHFLLRHDPEVGRIKGPVREGMRNAFDVQGATVVSRRYHHQQVIHIRLSGFEERICFSVRGVSLVSVFALFWLRKELHAVMLVITERGNERSE